MIDQVENEKPQTKFTPAAAFTVDDLETLKILADPLRLRIIELLAKPRTVKQIAADLDIPPTKLYYHVNQLEQKNLIVTVDTRIVSGIIEKRYQVAAKSFHIKKGLLSPGADGTDDGLSITLNTLFENAKSEIHESVQAGVIDLLSADDDDECEPLAMFQGRLRLYKEQLSAFQARLNALVKEFQELSHTPENSSGQTYKMLYVLYPTVRPFPSDLLDGEDDED